MKKKIVLIISILGLITIIIGLGLKINKKSEKKKIADIQVDYPYKIYPCKNNKQCYLGSDPMTFPKVKVNIKDEMVQERVKQINDLSKQAFYLNEKFKGKVKECSNGNGSLFKYSELYTTSYYSANDENILSYSLIVVKWDLCSVTSSIEKIITIVYDKKQKSLLDRDAILNAEGLNEQDVINYIGTNEFELAYAFNNLGICIYVLDGKKEIVYLSEIFNNKNNVDSNVASNTKQ